MSGFYTYALKRNQGLYESPTTYLDKAVRNVSKELSEPCLEKKKRCRAKPKVV
jgi:hypothetical protein